MRDGVWARYLGSWTMSLKSRLFPELELCRSANERAAAWKSAQRRMNAHRWIVFVILLIGGLMFPFVLPMLGVPVERRGLLRGINLLVVTLLGGGVSLMFRSKMRRWLREFLATIGIPVCVDCGYNLTGLPEPRCPECGQPFEPKGDET